MLGLDTVRAKTLHQTRALSELGWSFDVLTLHRNAGSIEADPSATIITMERGGLSRLRQVFCYLLQHRSRLHHAELYVAGRFAVVLAVLCRLLGVRLVVIERGDLMMCSSRRYPLPTRLSIYACYALANVVWFKEIYMAAFFERWRPRRSVLLPNAVPTSAAAVAPSAHRDLDLLWVNRLIPDRHPDWFADAVVQVTQARPVSVAVLGLSADENGAPAVGELERHLVQALSALPNAQCLTYADPHEYYARARFFVLPADVVFGNFALLEAMSAGVVPIVFAAPGVDEVVRDGLEGIVVDPTPDALAEALCRALAMDEPAWTMLSENAREMVFVRYGLEQWTRRLVGLYARVATPPLVKESV